MKTFSIRLVLVRDGVGFDGNTLNADLVGATTDPEVTTLAPALPPAVLDDPVLLAGLLVHAVAHQQHGVVHLLDIQQSLGCQPALDYFVIAPVR